MNPNRRHLVAAELLKLRTTRTTIGVGIAGVLLAVLVGLGNVGAAGQGPSPPAGSAAFVENVVGVSTLPAVVALLLGVLLAAGEYQHGTITTTFLATPRRLRVLGAKAAAGAIGGAAAATAMVLAASMAAFAVVVTKGDTLDVDPSRTFRAIAGLLLASALLGAMGALLGLVIRSQVAATVFVAGWALVIEGVLDVVTGGSLRHWLPGGAAADLAGAGSRPLWAAAALVLAWTAAVAAAAVPLVERRDVS
jgi:ABC-type transport system involved in multi-copper enzyme maturation permease subunit